MSLVTINNFDITKLSISDIKKPLNSPSSIAYLNYNGGKLRIQVPQMPIPYDSGDYNSNGKFKAQLSFRDRDINPKVQKYYEILEAIDNFVISHAAEKENAKKWFKLPGATKEMVNAFFTPSTRIGKDKDGNPKDYPPTQSVSLKKSYATGSFETFLFDDKKRPLEGILPTDVLRRGAEISSIVDCGGVWIGDKKFGITWKLYQARIDVAAAGAETGCLIEDDVEVDDSEIAAASKVVAKAPVKTAAPEEAEEEAEEAEEDDGEIVEPVPVPVKAAPKKIVKKVTKA